MKPVLTAIILILISITTYAQSSDSILVKRASLNYIEGFYEGDIRKLTESLSSDLHKYGYWKGKDGKYSGDPMTYDGAIEYANNVNEKQNFARPDAPKKVVILDIEEYVACAKVTAWWGIDYLLLSKKDDVWKIEQVLWQGPISTIKKAD